MQVCKCTLRDENVVSCHPERSEGSAFPDVRLLSERFLTSFGMTNSGVVGYFHTEDGQNGS